MNKYTKMLGCVAVAVGFGEAYAASPLPNTQNIEGMSSPKLESQRAQMTPAQVQAALMPLLREQCEEGLDLVWEALKDKRCGGGEFKSNPATLGNRDPNDDVSRKAVASAYFNTLFIRYIDDKERKDFNETEQKTLELLKESKKTHGFDIEETEFKDASMEVIEQLSEQLELANMPDEFFEQQLAQVRYSDEYARTDAFHAMVAENKRLRGMDFATANFAQLLNVYGDQVRDVILYSSFIFSGEDENTTQDLHAQHQLLSNGMRVRLIDYMTSDRTMEIIKLVKKDWKNCWKALPFHGQQDGNKVYNIFSRAIGAMVSPEKLKQESEQAMLAKMEKLAENITEDSEEN